MAVIIYSEAAVRKARSSIPVDYTMTNERPFSQACENNKDVILTILKSAFAPSKRVLEIGSGTGQHAVHFAEHLPHLSWQPTELAESIEVLQPWLRAYQGDNLLPAEAYDVSRHAKLDWQFDAVFSANTAHIMPWDITQSMIVNVANSLPSDGVLALYGPFNYKGQFTSESNAQFDLWLKARAAHQGIRDFEAVNELAESGGLVLIRDHDMPANNRLLVWKKLI